MGDQRFKPTPAMRFYAVKRSENLESSEKDIAKEIGVAPETVSRWKNVDGFSEWLQNAVLAQKQPLKELLQQVALENIEDFRFWRALAEKSHYLTELPKDEKGFSFSFEDEY